jgi:phosphatidylserine decarboxylase
MATSWTETRFVHRETGELRTERVYGERELRILYGTWWGAALLHAVAKRSWLSRFAAVMNRSSMSRHKIPSFIARYGIDATEAELPAAAYPSLDAFFARKLKPETRPIDANPLHLAAPAEGRALAFAALPQGRLNVKGSTVDIADLADVPIGFEPGACFVIRLAPCDYHRFHFPVDGEASAAQHRGRNLHSVHPIALTAGAASFRNKRNVSIIENTSCGPLLQIEVGALSIGSIVQTYAPGPVKKGQEKGYFHFGGSTVVLLCERGRVAPDQDLLDTTAAGLETLIKVGTRIARLTG